MSNHHMVRDSLKSLGRPEDKTEEETLVTSTVKDKPKDKFYASPRRPQPTEDEEIVDDLTPPTLGHRKSHLSHASTKDVTDYTNAFSRRNSLRGEKEECQATHKHNSLGKACERSLNCSSVDQLTSYNGLREPTPSLATSSSPNLANVNLIVDQNARLLMPDDLLIDSPSQLRDPARYQAIQQSLSLSNLEIPTSHLDDEKDDMKSRRGGTIPATINSKKNNLSFNKRAGINPNTNTYGNTINITHNPQLERPSRFSLIPFLPIAIYFLIASIILAISMAAWNNGWKKIKAKPVIGRPITPDEVQRLYRWQSASKLSSALSNFYQPQQTLVDESGKPVDHHNYAPSPFKPIMRKRPSSVERSSMMVGATGVIPSDLQIMSLESSPPISPTKAKMGDYYQYEYSFPLINPTMFKGKRGYRDLSNDELLELGYGIHNIDTDSINYITPEELTDHISAEELRRQCGNEGECMVHPNPFFQGSFSATPHDSLISPSRHPILSSPRNQQKHGLLSSILVGLVELGTGIINVIITAFVTVIFIVPILGAILLFANHCYFTRKQLREEEIAESIQRQRDGDVQLTAQEAEDVKNRVIPHTNLANRSQRPFHKGGAATYHEDEKQNRVDRAVAKRFAAVTK